MFCPVLLTSFIYSVLSTTENLIWRGVYDIVPAGPFPISEVSTTLEPKRNSRPISETGNSTSSFFLSTKCKVSRPLEVSTFLSLNSFSYLLSFFSFFSVLSFFFFQKIVFASAAGNVNTAARQIIKNRLISCFLIILPITYIFYLLKQLPIVHPCFIRTGIQTRFH